MTSQSELLPDLRAAAHITLRSFVTEFRSLWREFIATAFCPYHPERHYMRGPGPACARKRAAAVKREKARQ